MNNATIDEALEALNDSDISADVSGLAATFSCLESVETRTDFDANLDDMIDAAVALVAKLRALKGEVTP